MSEKRRDNRNRILREGEYQRKDGRYRFRYIDEDGKEKNVYSWRLDKNDPMPKGKKREPSLREKEKQIEADLFDRIVTNGGNYTVLELVEKYVSLKTGVRHNTVAGYKTVINMLKKESFGNLRIDKVRLSGRIREVGNKYVVPSSIYQKALKRYEEELYRPLSAEKM